MTKLISTFLFLVKLLVFFVTQAAGQVHEFRVKECYPTRCVYGYGTATSVGTLTNGHQVFVTAAHNLGQQATPKEVFVAIGTRWVPVKHWTQNQRLDLATFQMEMRPQACYTLAQSNPKPGEPLMARGFVAGEKGRRFQSQSITPSSHISDPNGIDIVVNGSVYGGQSGGAVVDSDGRLVGIISATRDRDRTSRIVSVETLRNYLQTTYGELPTCGAVPPAAAPPPPEDGPPPRADSSTPIVRVIPKEPITPDQSGPVNEAAPPRTADVGTDAPSARDWMPLITTAATYLGFGTAAATPIGSGLFVARWLYRRRKGRRQTPDNFRPRIAPRKESELRQLLRLRELEGRAPLHDALFGVLAEDRLRDDAESKTNGEADYARRLLLDLETEFNRIAPLSDKTEDYVHARG